MIIQNMHKKTNQISISRECSALGISRSGYNKWTRKDQIHYSDPEEMRLKNEIQTIAIGFPRYGYRRITIELHRRGLEVNHKVVYERKITPNGRVAHWQFMVQLSCRDK